MYGHPKYEIVHSDCPMCGKKEGAYMSSSRWDHNFSCCSDKCGEELGLLIKKNVKSKEYKSIHKEYSKLEKQMSKLVNKLDSIVKKDFKSDVIEFSMGSDVRVRNPRTI